MFAANHFTIAYSVRLNFSNSGDPVGAACSRDSAAHRGYKPLPQETRTRKLNGHGFTLLELVLVLVLMSMTVGLLIPRIGAGWKRMEEREFLQDLVQTLKRGHIRAMSSGQTVFFRIRGAERRYGLELNPAHGIPENVDIYSDKLERDPETQDRLILFYPDGSVSDNDLKITFDRQRSYRIFIHPISGTIRLVRMNS